MNPLLQKIQDRREFLRSGMRYALLGALVAVAGALTARQASPQARCPQIKLCRGCGALPACQLPQALEVKAATRS
jgi:hypothetical protein